MQHLSSNLLHNFQKFFYAAFIDDILPMAGLFKVGANNKSVGPGKVPDVIRVNPGSDEYWKTVSALHRVENLLEFGF